MRSAQTRALAMSHVGVTSDTAGCAPLGQILRMNETLVTAKAIVLYGLCTPRRHPDRFVKVLEREGHAVIPAVLGLSNVLRQKIVRKMALDAGCHRVVTRLLPRIVLAIHDVAVHAGTRVRAQIGETLCVYERLDTEPDQNTQGASTDDSQQAHAAPSDSHSARIERCGESIFHLTISAHEIGRGTPVVATSAIRERKRPTALARLNFDRARCAQHDGDGPLIRASPLALFEPAAFEIDQHRVVCQNSAD